MYVELKTGFEDNGPAWIGFGTYSKTGRTIYFNGKAFQIMGGRGIQGNYFDIETSEEYWISGIKKDGNDRHWAGSGKVFIDKDAVNEYLLITGGESIELKKFEIVFLNTVIDKEKFDKIQHRKLIK